MALGPTRLSSGVKEEKRRRIIPMNAADSMAEFKRQNKRSNIRPYVRSSTHKLRWTRELHESFMGAVNLLGGETCATPKRIVQLMDKDGVTLAHVKSHLQMLRIGKVNAEGMPVDGAHDHPVQFKPISKDSTSGQDLDLSPKEVRDVLTALRLLKEGRVSGTAGAEKLLQGLADFQRFTTLASEGKKKKLEDVKAHEFIASERTAEGDHIQLDLTMATTLASPQPGPKLQFRSPCTPEEATLSLGLSVSVR